MPEKTKRVPERLAFDLGDLDFELFVLILSFLNVYEIMKISKLNKHFYQLIYFPNGYEKESMTLDRSIKGFTFWKTLSYHQYPLPMKRRLRQYPEGMHPKIFLVHQHYASLVLWKIRMDMIIHQFEQKLISARTTHRHLYKVLFVVPSLWRAQKRLYLINAHFEKNDMRGHPFEKYEKEVQRGIDNDDYLFPNLERDLNQSVHIVVQLRQKYFNSTENRFEISNLQKEHLYRDVLGVMNEWFLDTKDKWHIGPSKLIDSVFGHYLRAQKRYQRDPDRYEHPPISLKILSRKRQIEESRTGSRMKHYTGFYLDKYVYLP